MSRNTRIVLAIFPGLVVWLFMFTAFLIPWTFSLLLCPAAIGASLIRIHSEESTPEVRAYERSEIKESLLMLAFPVWMTWQYIKDFINGE